MPFCAVGDLSTALLHYRVSGWTVTMALWCLLRMLDSQADQLWSVVHFPQTDYVIICVSVYVRERDRPVGERSKGLICSINRPLIKSHVSSSSSHCTLFFTATILRLKLGLVSGAQGAPGLKLSVVSLSVL